MMISRRLLFFAFVLVFMLQPKAGAGAPAPGDETHAIAGIGIVAVSDGGGSRVRDHILVKHVFDNGPAAKAHLMAGDEIVEIDGASVAGMSLKDAIANHLRGPLGSVVKITVVRPGTPGRRAYDLVRDIVPTE